jgi:hypothetical protein
MDTVENRLKLLEEKIVVLERLLRCSVCKNIDDLFYCSSCYIKVCENCSITRERTATSGDVEFIIRCSTCSL